MKSTTKKNKPIKINRVLYPEQYSDEKKTPAFQKLLATYKQGAYKRRLEFRLSESDFHDLTRSNCHYCGIAPFRFIEKNGHVYTYNGIDRMNSQKGYLIGNVVPCCTECNKMKLDTPYNEFLELIETIYLRLCVK